MIDRLVGLEPLAAIVGPGLPAAAVGFELPPDPGIVAFRDTPAGADDRLWLAIGTKERFGLGDLFRFGAIKRFVRAFHEAR